jgi:hypothetical protein
MRKILANKPFIFLLKLCIVVLSLGYIYRRIFLKENIDAIWNYYKEVFQLENNRFLFCLVIILMFVNWSLESEKWRFLISKIEKISFQKSLKAIFTGVTVSIFTPNRVGEYAGRVFFLNKADRIKAVIITIISSAGQLLMTFIVGTVCLIPYVFRQYPEEIYIKWICCVLVIVFNILYIIIFININNFVSVVYKIRWLKKARQYLKVLSYYSPRELSVVLGFSVVRYFVFSIQFLILLRILHVHINLFLAMESIGLIFLSLAVIPTFALSELGVRGSVAIYFLSKFSSNELGIITASFTLWFINLVIPALIGSCFIFGARIIKQKN